MASPFGTDQDIYYMNQALKQAKLAFAHNEVPIGAVVVNEQGDIIARAYNNVETSCTQAAHAEIRALQKAGKKVGDWRLENCWIYVTLEPCSMCMSMIELSRLKGVIFGASSPLFGYRLDKQVKLGLYKKGVVKVVEGIQAENSALILKQFFQQKRKRSE